MRVEFVSPYDHNPQTGIGRYVHTITRHLSKSVDATICRPKFLPLTDRFSPLRNIPIGIEDHVPGSIVHFPQIMGCAMMLYRPYHPSIATVHDLGFLELPEEWDMFDPIARRMLRLSLAGLRRVDMILAVSEFTRQGVIKHLGVSEDRVVTIHSGIDHELFRPIPDAREILVDRYPHLATIVSSPWLLYVGSELPRKNVGTLLQAVALVRELIPNIHLIKVGSAGGEKYRQDTLRLINELGLENHVLLFEDVTEQELPLFYNAVEVFVTASKLEGFGFPVLEAMACGTPAVCSEAGSLMEITGTAGLHYQPDKAGALVSTIMHVIEDKQLVKQLRCNGIDRALAFTWDSTATQTSKQYKALIT